MNTKKWVAALLVLTLLAGDATAQTQHKKKSRKKQRTTAVAKRPAKPAEKSLNDGTTGVLGRDTIRLNKKGMHRNMNSNTSSEASY